MWAFILVDLKEKKIIASRDRFSVKPLYYLNADENWYFSSEIKQLLPLLHNKTVNKSVLHRFVKQNLLDYDSNTFFEGVHKIKPRHNLVIDFKEKKVSENKYWDFTFHNIPENELVNSFHELFEDSIRLRLRSDVEVGSLLSGGLDSSAITVVANKISGGKIQSFSVVSDEKKYSEEKFVDILVNEKKISNRKLRFNPAGMLQSLKEVLYHQDEPFGGFSVVAQYLIFKQVKNETDVKVILSGQGSDEVLMGYLKFFFFNLRHLAREQQYAALIRQLFFSLVNRTVLWQFRIGEAKRYMPGRLKSSRNYLLYDLEPEDTWTFRNLENRQISDIEKYSIPALAHFEDRNSMAFSIESRLPFLDHRLVDFLLSVPASLKIKNGWTKYLLRQSLPELPEAIRWRRDKQGFTTPEELWLKRELKEEISATFRHSKLEELGLINEKIFSEEYSKFCAGNSAAHYSDFLRIYVAEQWAKMNF